MEGNASEQSFNIEDLDHMSKAIDIYNEALIEIYLLPISIVLGVIFTLVALLLLMTKRLWLKHEGYIYIAALLISSLVFIVFIYVPFWLQFFHLPWHISSTSDFMCKLWIFLFDMCGSTDWFLVAMLLDVFLRYQLMQPERDWCCAKFATNFCTAFGAKFAIGCLLVAFVLVNWWRFVSSHLQEFCTVSKMWYEEFWLWSVLSLCLIKFVPTLILIPILSLLIIWVRRKRSFASFGPLDANYDATAEEFAKLSLGVAAALFICSLPHFVVHIWNFAPVEFNHSFVIIWYVTLFLLSTYLFIFPILFLSLVSEIRTMIRTRCCVGNIFGKFHIGSRSAAA